MNINIFGGGDYAFPEQRESNIMMYRNICELDNENFALNVFGFVVQRTQLCISRQQGSQTG